MMSVGRRAGDVWSERLGGVGEIVEDGAGSLGACGRNLGSH